MQIRKILKKSLLYAPYIDIKARYINKYPIFYTKYRYKKFYNEKLDLKTPTKLSEKIQYLKLFNYPKNNLVVLASDKFTLHKYLKEKKLSEYAIPYIEVFENINQIDFNRLPNKFVLKKTNASGMNLIVKDKQKLNFEKIRTEIEGWMNIDFGLKTAERHYSASTSRIICEPYLDLGDEFRFFMVSGNIAFIQVIKWDWNSSEDGNRLENDDIILGHRKHYRLHFDSNFQLLWADKDVPNTLITLPNYMETMRDVASTIGNDFSVVRVDFNEVEKKPKITELTFTPANGFLDILKYMPEDDTKFGTWIDNNDLDIKMEDNF
ncbi:ATP-grasp fold amidoligase family protein [Enterococcus hailinensis]|uniref:ATP-grasp fold amidoligase family protein n=1 Tax=Enterococcus hailinensis TaxID=3238988 RepID=UPI0038B2AF88